MNLELRNYIRPSVHALRATHQVRRMRNDLEALFEGTCVDAVVLQGRGAFFRCRGLGRVLHGLGAVPVPPHGTLFSGGMAWETIGVLWDTDRLCAWR